MPSPASVAATTPVLPFGLAAESQYQHRPDRFICSCLAPSAGKLCCKHHWTENPAPAALQTHTQVPAAKDCRGHQWSPALPPPM